LDKEKETNDSLHRVLDTMRKQHESEVSTLVKNMESLEIASREKESKQKEKTETSGPEMLTLQVPEDGKTLSSEISSNYQPADIQFEKSEVMEEDGEFPAVPFQKPANERIASDDTFESFSISEYLQSDVKVHTCCIIPKKMIG
jgi:hypothetical protein